MSSIDLRSDTVTKPSPAMREAMKEAKVGDDVFEEDPTVIELEELSAKTMGKEKGLFVSSGTMGNLVSLLSHCDRGDEVLLARAAHVFQYEVRAASTLGGISLNPLGNSKFSPITGDMVEKNIAPVDVHKPITKLVSLENTLNGMAIPKSQIDEVAKVAKEHNLKVHLDGARLFNAACALKISPREIVEEVDSVQFCFSKGLAAPVGSMVCGSKEFIQKARHWRKALGGGTRQAGVLAAPCLVAINQMTERLSEDHKNARVLAEAVNKIPGLKVDMEYCQTNMVFIETSITGKTAAHLVELLDNEGVKVLDVAKNTIRAVTHYGITDSDIDKVIEALKIAAKQLMPEKSLA